MDELNERRAFSHLSFNVAWCVLAMILGVYWLTKYSSSDLPFMMVPTGIGLLATSTQWYRFHPDGRVRRTLCIGLIVPVYTRLFPPGHFASVGRLLLTSHGQNGARGASVQVRLRCKSLLGRLTVSRFLNADKADILSKRISQTTGIEYDPTLYGTEPL